ncbi:hypothetical protein ACWD3I_44435 [Streptomyces sp. NPDC002817]|uniref:hypothetical protein n=1 Tax=Streptomyces sp. NPDC088357 TaxID=3154655 RepID=UPI00342F2C8D
MEEDAENGARELVRLLLQGHFDLRARREEVELAALDADGRAALAAVRTRLEKEHRRQLATGVGPVTVWVRAERCGLPNCYPADQVLGLPRERHSLGLRLGGIYALQRNMQDSPRDHVTIANVLATYIRAHAAAPPPQKRAGRRR